MLVLVKFGFFLMHLLVLSCSISCSFWSYYSPFRNIHVIICVCHFVDWLSANSTCQRSIVFIDTLTQSSLQGAVYVLCSVFKDITLDNNICPQTGIKPTLHWCRICKSSSYWAISTYKQLCARSPICVSSEKKIDSKEWKQHKQGFKLTLSLSWRSM